MSLAALVSASLSSAASGRSYATERLAMVASMEAHVRATLAYLGGRSFDPLVLAAMKKVPRHLFVPASEQWAAYENRPLPIGHGQTISQPYIVAVMTELAALDKNDVVLEVGSGSGYQTAILAELAREVYSVEIIEPLAEQARQRLAKAGYKNVHLRLSNGYYGWPAHAPFDAIIVTAASGRIPPPLIEQLKAGGRMVIPVGSRFLTQQLTLVEKDEAGRVHTRQLLPVRFVPLTGKH